MEDKKSYIDVLNELCKYALEYVPDKDKFIDLYWKLRDVCSDNTEESYFRGYWDGEWLHIGHLHDDVIKKYNLPNPNNGDRKDRFE